MAKQGDVVHCQRGHELTISQLPSEMRWHVWERKVCGDEEINLSPDSCPRCQVTALAQPKPKPKPGSKLALSVAS